jgi:hypothetical protein
MTSQNAALWGRNEGTGQLRRRDWRARRRRRGASQRAAARAGLGSAARACGSGDGAGDLDSIVSVGSSRAGAGPGPGRSPPGGPEAGGCAATRPGTRSDGSRTSDAKAGRGAGTVADPSCSTAARSVKGRTEATFFANKLAGVDATSIDGCVDPSCTRTSICIAGREDGGRPSVLSRPRRGGNGCVSSSRGDDRGPGSYQYAADPVFRDEFGTDAARDRSFEREQLDRPQSRRRARRRRTHSTKPSFRNSADVPATGRPAIGGEGLADTSPAMGPGRERSTHCWTIAGWSSSDDSRAHPCARRERAIRSLR